MKVPKGWEVKIFGNILKLSKAKYDPKKDNKCFHCIELENISQETGKIINYKNSSELYSTKNIFKAGDVLFGKLRPYLKKYAMPSFDGVCSSEIWVFSPTKYIINPYLFQFIQTKKFISEASKSTGSKMPRADWSVISELVFYLPPLPEQRKIAKILGCWDRAIAACEQLIATSKQQKQALMQQLLTAKKRFGEFSGEWKHRMLSDLSTIKKGKSLSSNNIKKGNIPVIAGGKSSPYTHNEYTDENVITVSASGAYAGYVSYHQYRIWASDCSVLTAKGNNKITFIYQYLLLKQKMIYSFQSGGAQPHIYPKDLSVIKVRAPTLPEQQKIAQVLTAADSEIEILQQKLAKLQQEKQALMQQLLTGKRRVKVDESDLVTS